MRTFLIVLLTLIIILGIAAAFLIVQFDPNDFRPELEKHIGETVGADAELGEISIRLGWNFGLEISGLELRERSAARDLLLKTGRVTGGIDLRALLDRHVAFQGLVLESPQIYLRRGADGTWNWQARSPAAAASVAGPSRTGNPAPAGPAVPAGEWQFSIGRIEIHHGKIDFQDESLKPPFRASLQNVEILARQPDPRSPIQLEAYANLLRSGPPDISLKGSFQPGSDSMNFKLNYEDNRIVVEGNASDLAGTPQFSGRLDIYQLDLESITPESLKRREHLAGTLTTRLDVSGRGTHPDALKKTLRVRGKLDLRNGALRNVNLVEDVLANLTPIPALGNLVLSELPPELDPLVKGKDTPFEVFQTDLRVEDGRIYAEKSELKHAEYLVTSDGMIDLFARTLDFRARLIFFDKMSAFLVKKVKELSALQEPGGRLVIPFVYRGPLNSPKVLPDLNYVASQLIQTRGEELINKGLEQLGKLLEK